MISPAVHYERVREHLISLKLQAALTELDPLLERAAKEDYSLIQALDVLLEMELSDRFERRVASNLRLSGIPFRKTLAEFDFSLQESIPKRTIDELATLRFLRNGENVLLLGPTGVGKTHLAVSLALEAINQGYRVYFLTLHDLVNKAREARERNRLHVLHATLLRADIFVLDEVGFQPLEQLDATFLFEAVNK